MDINTIVSDSCLTPTLHNGFVVGEGDESSWTGVLACTPGFTLVGSSKLKCRNGQWSANMPVCTGRVSLNIGQHLISGWSTDSSWEMWSWQPSWPKEWEEGPVQDNSVPRSSLQVQLCQGVQEAGEQLGPLQRRSLGPPETSYLLKYEEVELIPGL